MSRYVCPGLAMEQPTPEDSYIACYLAGHPCPRESEEIVEKDEAGTLTTMRCSCCGQHRGSMYIPGEWQVGEEDRERALRTLRELSDPDPDHHLS